MTIRFQCPSGHRLTAPDSRAGQRVRCPRCRQPVSVPGEPQEKAEEKAADKAVAKGKKTPSTDPQPADSGKPDVEKPAAKTPPPLPEPAEPQRPTAKAEPVAAEQRPAEVPAAEAAPEAEEPTAAKSSVPQEESQKQRWADQVLPAMAILDQADALPPPLPGRSVGKEKEPLSKADQQPAAAKPDPKPAIAKPNPKPATPKPDRRPAVAKLDPKPPAPKPDRKPTALPAKSDTTPQPAPSKAKLFRAEKLPEVEPPAPPPPPAPMAIPDFAAVEPSPPSARFGRRSRRDRKRAKPEGESSPWSTSEEQAPSAPAASAVPLPAASAGPLLPMPGRPKRDPRRPKVIPPGVYRPDVGKIATVRGLAVVLSLVVAFSIGPAVYTMFSGTGPVPAWSRLVLLVGALQMAYILWMVAAPDWSSVWVVMLAFAAVSAVYGMATGVALAPPISQPEFLGMSDQVHRSAKFWCAAVTATMALATYLCGRNSARWRRSLEF